MVVFGPILTDDDSYGLAVVETDDEQALRDFAAQDPVATTGTAAFELGGWPRGTSADADRRVAISRMARLMLGLDGLGRQSRTTRLDLDRSSKRAHGDAALAIVACPGRSER